MTGPRSEQLPTSDGSELKAFVWEGEGGTPVVLVHGYAEHALRHRRLAESLAALGSTVVAVDLPGHGTSGGVRGAVRSYSTLRGAVRSAVALASGSAGDPGLRPALFGHSMGGAVALSLALDEPASVSRLALSSPYLIDGARRPTWLQSVPRMVAGLLPQLPVAYLDTSLLSRDPQVEKGYRSDPLVYSGPVQAASAATMIGEGISLLGRAARLAVPTLIVHGEADGIASVRGSRKLAESAPKGTVELVTVPGGFHELHNEPAGTGVPESYFATIVSFLTGRRL